MTPLRVLFPALIGSALVVVGIQSVLTGLRYTTSADVVGEIRAAIPPLSIGAALLLTAFAIARRTLLGWLLGLVVAVLFAVAGLGILVFEIPYLGRGGLDGAIAGAVVVIAGVWTLLAVGYGRFLWQGRATFASSWQRADRWIAAGLVAMIVASTGVTVALGAIGDQVVADIESDQAMADALVRATALDVRVIEATFESGSGSDPDALPPAVEHLELELMLRSPEAYRLQTAPTLCLVDVATAQHEAYKPGIFCWGAAVGAVVLKDGFVDLAVPAGMTTIRVELDRAASACEFGAGEWNAELVIWPLVSDAGAGEPAQPPWPTTLIGTFTIEPEQAGPVPTDEPVAPTFAPCTGASTARR